MTVLVPKTKARQYYGTYAGHDFYYEYTSVANMRRDTIGEKKSAANESRWKQWVLGAIDLNQDQTSSLKVSSYICPVGVTSGSDFIYYGDTYNGAIQANDLSKNSILQLANTYSNHGNQVFYSVTSYRVTENWNNG